MKKFSLLTILLAVAAFAYGQNYNVTFRVDMTDFLADGGMIHSSGMHVAGSFQDEAGQAAEWTPGTAPMMDMGNNVWEVTYQLPAGTYEYKFVTANDWPNGEDQTAATGYSDESVSGGCGAGNGNRSLTVSNADVTENYCFNQCVACGVDVPTVNVTLSVDMNNMITQYGMPANGVSVAGSFQGWTPGDTPLADNDNDGIYEVTVEVDTGSTMQYKFLFGDAWGYDENVPSECNVGNNRQLEVGTSSMTVPTVCFASCAADCPDLGEPVNVTFFCDMGNSGQVINSEGIHLAGTLQFPAWDKDSLEMTDVDGDFIYEYSISLYPSEYAYKFINGDNENVPAGSFEEENFETDTVGGCLNPGGNRFIVISPMTPDTAVGFIFNQCTEIDVDSLLSVNTNDLFLAESGLAVQPNPVTGVAQIKFNNDEAEAYRITISNLMGQTVRSEAAFIGSSLEVSAGNMAPGVYFVTLQNQAGAVATRKFVVR